MPRSIALGVGLVLALAFRSSPAHASPLLELLGSAGDMGGQQGRVAATGASAAYFNPALLPDVPTGVSFGFIVLGSGIDVSLDPRTDPRNDVPNDLGNGQRSDGSRWDGYPLGTDLLQNGREESAMHPQTSPRPRGAAGTGDDVQTYEAVGLVARFFDERFAVGFYGLIPNENFLRLRTFYVDEREQYSSNSLHPELYSDRLAPLSMAVAAGYRFNDAFSIGLGSTFAIRAVAGSPVYVPDPAKLTDLILNVDAKANIGMAPHFGLAWNPLARWRLTATAHAPQTQEVTAEITYVLSTGLEQSSTMEFLYHYMPWQVSLGTSVDLLSDPSRSVELVASALYGRWSKYIDRQNERPLPGLAWQDTITAALGVHSQLGAFAGSLDLQFKPTPVPLQFGRSNYVDNNRLGSSVSAEYAFTVLDTQLSVGLNGQFFWMLQRSVRKLTPAIRPDGNLHTPSLVRDEVPDDGQIGGDPIPEAPGLQTNNPGWPGFTSGGWIASGAIYLELAL